MSTLPLVGIDIGASSIKMVELVPNGNQKWKLTGAASISAPAGGVNGGPGNIAVITQSIAKVRKEAGMKVRRAVVSLPEEQVSSHVVEMPLMSEDEVRQALEWQVEQYIPISADKATWSYEIIKKDPTAGVMEILLIAVAKNLVNAYIQTVEQAGLEVVAMETELMALARACVTENFPLVILTNIGAQGTDLGVVSQGQLVFSRTIPTGGSAFNRAIEVGLNLDTSTAEQYKLSYGLAADKLNGELAKAMQPVVKVIGTEIRKTGDFYLSKHSGESIKAVIFSGGSALMPELISELSGVVGMEIVMGNPFTRVNMDQKQLKTIEGSAPFYGVATGLAMRQI